MNDRLGFGLLVVGTYITYMVCTWPHSPDGFVLSFIVGALAALAGVSYGKTIERRYQKQDTNEGPES